LSHALIAHPFIGLGNDFCDRVLTSLVGGFIILVEIEAGFVVVIPPFYPLFSVSTFAGEDIVMPEQATSRSQAGKVLGSAKSESKSRASRQNGLKGGRPTGSASHSRNRTVKKEAE